MSTPDLLALGAVYEEFRQKAQRADDWPLHGGQQQVHASEKPVIFAIAGTGGGKTSYAPRWCDRERQRNPHGGLVIAPYKILKRQTMPTFLEAFAHQGAWDSKADGIWRFHDGQAVYFASADTPESIEGVHVGWAWLDECGQRQFPQQSWEAVQRRVRLHQGRILGTTTPYVLGWFTETWQQTRAGERPDIDIFTWSSDVNPSFPKEEFERARRTLPAWQFNMFYLAQLDRPAGLVYAEIGDECWVDELPTLHSWEHYAGLDFGFNNPTAVLYGALSDDDVLYVYDEYYETGRTDAENARAAMNGVKQAWADPAAPEGIEEFHQQGWHVQGGERHEPKAGIVEVIERAKSGRLKFKRGLSDLAREMDSYVWDERQPDKPVKMHDHLMDALRYMCWGLKQRRSPEVFSL